MMICQNAKKRMEAWLEGALGSADHEELLKHLENCVSCREEFETCRKMETVLREAFTFSPSSSRAAQSVLAAIADAAPAAAGRPFALWRMAAGFLILAGLAVSFYAGRQSVEGPIIKGTPTAYRVSELEGAVLVKRPGSRVWLPLGVDSKLYTGDELLSLPDGRVRLEVAADSSVELFENSMLVLDVSEDKTDLRLVHGKLDADLQSPHGPFFVTTPHGRAEALGTEFTVTVE